MYKKLLCVLMVMLFASFSQAESGLTNMTVCKTDKVLKSKSWVVYKMNFKKHLNRALNWMQEDAEYFKVEGNSKNTVIRSSVANRFLRVLSYDHIVTPRDLMIGDVVILEDAFDKTPVEVRWFDGNRKYVAYSKAETPCATNLIPFVVNSLY